jgi:NB-ARC domain
MALFVNREKELDLIEDAVQALLDRHRLLRTPIVEIYGVGGMGKTALLKQVEQYCHNSNLPCIALDIEHISVSLEHDLIARMSQYLQSQDSITEQSVISVTRALLGKGPVVMLFDTVDSASPEQLNILQLLLHELIDQEELFVVLASKKALSFLQREQSVARKLIPLALESLSREHCEHFFASEATPVEAETRDLIFEWTKGYPLAMNVMIEAINGGLDTRTEQGKAELLVRLKDQVIYQEILGDLEPQMRSYYYSALQLFSLPRRFSIVIMQDLIEEFSPDLRRDGVLAYLSLPKNICDATNVMHWNMIRAGYAVDAPVRTLFLLILRQEQPDLYFAIHTFLAQKNLEMAQEVSGSDRMRCLREYLYHLAHSQAPSEQALLKVTEMVSRETPEVFVQFAEEFAQDHELREALGQQLPVVEAAIRKYQEKDREGEE